MRADESQEERRQRTLNGRTGVPAATLPTPYSPKLVAGHRAHRPFLPSSPLLLCPPLRPSHTISPITSQVPPFAPLKADTNLHRPSLPSHPSSSSILSLRLLSKTTPQLALPATPWPRTRHVGLKHDLATLPYDHTRSRLLLTSAIRGAFDSLAVGRALERVSLPIHH